LLLGALAAGGVKLSADYDPPEAGESFVSSLRSISTI
jgi:hypothetical protein